MRKRVGLLALARPTFDVAFAEETARSAFAALDRAGMTTVGERSLLFDAPATEAALERLRDEDVDALLILQVTFTDASMTMKIASAIAAPLAVWAFPEPRTGGRLRLNSFCGLNLASHALGRMGRDFSYLYARPDAAGVADLLAELLDGQASDPARPRDPAALPASAGGISADAAARAEAALMRLQGARIGLVGRHPDGFETCRFSPENVARIAGMSVVAFDLASIFDRARAVSPARRGEYRQDVADLEGIDAVDASQLDRSLAAYGALRDLQAEERLAGFAIRCWPETFTEYGAAVCGPMAMMGGAGRPCACEADVMGAATSLLMQEIAGSHAFLADIVDMDTATDTAVVWHCGLASRDLCDPDFRPQATIHSNRRMPLLHHFPLKPGPVTLARLSQARNGLFLALASGDMLRAAPSFSGTSGVLRFSTNIVSARDALIGERLEHHVSLVYGDHVEAMRAAAQALGLPVVRFG
jgi:L-fucose isomerase-like protein